MAGEHFDANGNKHDTLNEAYMADKAAGRDTTRYESGYGGIDSPGDFGVLAKHGKKIIVGVVSLFAAYGLLGTLANPLRAWGMPISGPALILPSLVVAAGLYLLFFKGNMIAKILFVAIAAPCSIMGAITFFLPTGNPVWNHITKEWRRGFYDFHRTEVTADEAVLRSAPNARASAAMTLAAGDTVDVRGAVGEEWFYAEADNINDGTFTFGYIRAEDVSLSPGGVREVRPARLIVDNVKLHRFRRWPSVEMYTLNKNNDVLLVSGLSENGWSPVYAKDEDGYKVGYINDALLFIDDGSGAKVPAQPEGTEAIATHEMMAFTVSNPRFISLSDLLNSSYLTLKEGEKVILLSKPDKKGWAPAVYSGGYVWARGIFQEVE